MYSADIKIINKDGDNALTRLLYSYAIHDDSIGIIPIIKLLIKYGVNIYFIILYIYIMKTLCMCLTKKGTKCKNTTTSGQYCHLHINCKKDYVAKSPRKSSEKSPKKTLLKKSPETIGELALLQAPILTETLRNMSRHDIKKLCSSNKNIRMACEELPRDFWQEKLETDCLISDTSDIKKSLFKQYIKCAIVTIIFLAGPSISVPLIEGTVREFCLHSAKFIHEPTIDGDTFLLGFHKKGAINTFENRNKQISEFLKDGDNVIATRWYLGGPPEKLAAFKHNLSK
jgi:hypothetical protein